MSIFTQLKECQEDSKGEVIKKVGYMNFELKLMFQFIDRVFPFATQLYRSNKVKEENYTIKLGSSIYYDYVIDDKTIVVLKDNIIIVFKLNEKKVLKYYLMEDGIRGNLTIIKNKNNEEIYCTVGSKLYKLDSKDQKPTLIFENICYFLSKPLFVNEKDGLYIYVVDIRNALIKYNTVTKKIESYVPELLYNNHNMRDLPAVCENNYIVYGGTCGQIIKVNKKNMTAVHIDIPCNTKHHITNLIVKDNLIYVHTDYGIFIVDSKEDKIINQYINKDAKVFFQEKFIILASFTLDILDYNLKGKKLQLPMYCNNLVVFENIYLMSGQENNEEFTFLFDSHKNELFFTNLKNIVGIMKKEEKPIFIKNENGKISIYEAYVNSSQSSQES